MSKESKTFLQSHPFTPTKSFVESAKILESKVWQKTKDLTLTDYISMTLPWTISWIFTSSSGLGAVCPEVEANEAKVSQVMSVNLTPLYVLIGLLILMNLVILGFIISDKLFLFQFRKAITDDVEPLIERNPEAPIEELEEMEDIQAEEEAEERAEERIEAERKEYVPPDPDEFYVLADSDHELVKPKFQNDTLTSEEYTRKLGKGKNKE
jgi:hypothetical protein